MTEYITLAEVKALIRETGSSHDTEITTSIEDAAEYTDSIMQLHETVPLSGTVPEPIKRANKFLAAALYYYHNPVSDQSMKQAEAWWKFGDALLTSYIIHKYYTGELDARE